VMDWDGLNDSEGWSETDGWKHVIPTNDPGIGGDWEIHSDEGELREKVTVSPPLFLRDCTMAKTQPRIRWGRDAGPACGQHLRFQCETAGGWVTLFNHPDDVETFTYTGGRDVPDLSLATCIGRVTRLRILIEAGTCVGYRNFSVEFLVINAN